MARLRSAPKWIVSGVSEAGYYVYFYIAGTTTPKDTYTSNTEAVANTNLVVLDARGEADIWLSGTYKVAVYTGDKDVDGVLVWTVDDYGEGEDQVTTGEFNLVKNGSFETDAVTTGEPDNWTFVDYSTGVHAIDATDQYHGLNSLKFTSVGAGGGYATSEYFEAQEAKTIFVDWVMRSSVADVRNVVDILWATSAKTAISTTNIYDDSATNPTAWTTKSGGGVPPSTARYAQLRVYGCHSSDATSGSTWFDNVIVNANYSATTTRKGIAEIATQAEVDTGTDTDKYVTPETLRGKQSRGALTKISLGASQAITTATYTAIEFDSEVYDTDTIHDVVTNNSRLTVPTGVTRIKLSGKISFASNGTGVRNVNIYRNASGSFAGHAISQEFSPSAAFLTELVVNTPVIIVSAGQYFELMAYQSSGGNLSALGDSWETWFAMEIIE